MVGSGIASSLIHEAGHQAAALLNLVPSLRGELRARQRDGDPNRDLWATWERWISEIVADFWSVARVGVTSTMSDPHAERTLSDLVADRPERLFHVGRLDTETEGVILLTNHGELAHRLTHPKYGVKKTYLAAIYGPIPRDLGKQLKDGIQLEDGYARADHFRVVEQTGRNYLVEVTLHEGRKHIVRRMLAEAGFPVDKLVRTAFGPITLGDQKSGWLRRLSNTEVGMLMREVEL